ncbi:MAG: hypothetical protein E7254_03250 [Lachnospiraceae bacterium]|nr:hypothetical protein [Lachnospiraceae bacterium]
MKLNFLDSYIELLVFNDEKQVINNLKKYKVVAKNVIIKKNEGIGMRIPLDDYDFLLKVGILNKNNHLIKSVSKSIRLFILFRRNIGYFINCIIFIFIIHMCSAFVWRISFEGNSRITDNQLVNFLEQNNVETGIRKNKIKCNEIEEMLRKKFDFVTWTCAEIKGTNLIIHIKENTVNNVNNDENNNNPNKDNNNSNKKPSDIVSISNSQVQSIIVRSGVPMVKKGDIVKQGDVLISGTNVVTNEFGEETGKTYLQADGDVVGKTVYYYNSSFDRSIIRRKVIKRGKGFYYLTFGSKYIAFKPVENNEYEICERRQLKLWNAFYIPLYLCYKNKYSYVEKEELMSENETKMLAEKKVADILEGMREKRVQILQKGVNIYVGKKQCSIKGTITILEPLGKKTKIQKEGITTSNERD